MHDEATRLEETDDWAPILALYGEVAVDPMRAGLMPVVCSMGAVVIWLRDGATFWPVVG